MASKPNFKKIHILVADNDVLLANVLTQNLRAMGFSQVNHVRNGAQAMQYIQDHTIDLLITEWEMSPTNGLELIDQVRSMRSYKRTMPIIMLTGRGEVHDVSTARDVGITEFVVKPFTAQTLYSRIERIADHPRGFVLSDRYAGPDRRRKMPPAAADSERRISIPMEVDPEKNTGRGIKLPAVVKPDHSFKKNMGVKGPLSKIITPNVLAEAQKTIDAMADASLQWLKEDIAKLKQSHQGLATKPNVALLEQAKEAALSIKARAGTFGYPLVSQVGRLLYLFLCTDLRPGNAMHLSVMLKHIETIQVMVAQKLKASDGVGSELVAELKRLAVMYR